MYCKSAIGARNLACASFCSGSLISNSVVLTAGHCVYDPHLSGFQRDSPPIPLGNFYVLVGSSDWQELGTAHGARLVRVSGVENAGYGKNHRFPLDDDVGLVFLAECVDVIPGRIEPVKLATSTFKYLDACTEVTSLGYGRHANVPSDLFVHDGKLRVLKGDTLHDFSVCQASFREAVLRGHNDTSDFDRLEKELVVEKHMCAGGDSLGSTCFGDSGGAVLARDASTGLLAVVGVTSFGPLAVCMASPDFIARVPSYSAWIRMKMETHFLPCSDSVSQSFASWPLEVPSNSSDNMLGRCAQSEWQCKETGACIPAEKVCDDIFDCADESDEKIDFCKSGLPSDTGGIEAGFVLSAAEAELDTLIDQLVQEETIVAVNGTDLTNEQPLTVTIVGMLHTVDHRVRSLSLLATPESNNDAVNSSLCLSIEYQDSVRNRLYSCNSSFQEVVSRVKAERRLENRAERDSSTLKSICASFTDCLGSDFNAWYEQLLACVETAGLSTFGSFLSRQWSSLTLCGHRLDEFIAVNSTRQEYADSFNERFGQKKCESEMLSAQDLPNGPWAHTVTAMYISILLLINL